MFLNCSACFGRHTTHNQKLKNYNCSLWFSICFWLPPSAMAQPSQRVATKKYVKREAAITVFELLIIGSLSPKTCWGIKKHWNNKFYYMVASWFFLWDLCFSELSVNDYQKTRPNISKYRHIRRDTTHNVTHLVIPIVGRDLCKLQYRHPASGPRTERRTTHIKDRSVNDCEDHRMPKCLLQFQSQ
jgi:hypothetical protein